MEAIAGTLGINWAGLLWQAANYLLLLVLLRQFLYKPVTRMLDARATRVRESLQQADQVRRAAEQAEADRQTLLAETRREAEHMRARADEQAKRIVEEAATRARDEADRILEQARAAISQERQQMRADIMAQVADLVVLATDRVTRHALDAQAQRSLVQQFLVDGGAGGLAARPDGRPDRAN